MTREKKTEIFYATEKYWLASKRLVGSRFARVQILCTFPAMPNRAEPSMITEIQRFACSVFICDCFLQIFFSKIYEVDRIVSFVLAFFAFQCCHLLRKRYHDVMIASRKIRAYFQIGSNITEIALAWETYVHADSCWQSLIVLDISTLHPIC